MEERGKEVYRKNEIYTKIIKAGKRLYFIDVKLLKDKLYYLTITESVKHTNTEKDLDEFRKFRVVLFPEDFDKFTDGLNDVINFIKKDLMPNFDFNKFTKSNLTIKNDEINKTKIENDIISDLNV